MPGYALGPSFLGIGYLRHFGRIWKIISLLNSANVSTSNMTDETNFRNPFLGLGSPFGVADIYLVETPQCTTSDYTTRFPSVYHWYWFARKRSSGLCARLLNSTLFVTENDWQLIYALTIKRVVHDSLVTFYYGHVVVASPLYNH